MNPADAYLDIISGGIPTAAGQTLDIPASWRSKQALSHIAAGPAAASAAATGAAAAAGSGRRSSSGGEEGLDPAGNAASIAQQVMGPAVSCKLLC